MSFAESEIPTGYFSSLRYRSYRLFWVGRLISQLGTWIQTTAMMWALYEITGSAFQLGLNGLFRAVPSILFGLFGGTLADRFERRKITLTTDSVLVFLPLTLGILAQTDRLAAWHIYVITFLTALVDGIGAPARQALYPNLIPANFLPNAIALNSVLQRFSILVGPSLAGLLLGFFGIAGAFYANSLSYLGSVISVFMMVNVSSSGGLKGRRLTEGLKEGLVYIRSDPVLFSVVVLEAFTSLFGINQVFLTIFAKDVLQAGPSGLGLMFSIRGAGGVLGSMSILLLAKARHQGRLLLASSLLIAVSFAAFGLFRSFSLSLYSLFLLGLADTVAGVSRNILLQSKAPDRMRGRANSIFQLTGRGLTPLGHTQAGILIPLLTASGTVYASAFVILGATLLINFSYPELRRFVLTEQKV
jgi:MFS family permease